MTHSESAECGLSTLTTLARALDDVCRSNAGVRGNSSFETESVPRISVHDYLIKRIYPYCQAFDSSVYLVAALYVHRLCKASKSVFPTMHNIHRLMATALLVASKATDGAAGLELGRRARRAGRAERGR